MAHVIPILRSVFLKTSMMNKLFKFRTVFINLPKVTTKVKIRNIKYPENPSVNSISNFFSKLTYWNAKLDKHLIITNLQYI